METITLLKNKGLINGKIEIGVRYFLLLLISVVLFTPFILSFLGTLKTNAEIIAWPPKILPENWLWKNWADTWNTDLGNGGTFPRWLFNTSFLSILTATLQILFCAMGGYAFARLKFRGKNLIFTFMLSSMMLPGIITLVPKYVFMAKIHLINTYWALILPGSVEAFGVFLLTQYFKSIPGELEDACKIDGANYGQIFKNVVIPLSKPALLTLFILKFQSMWNNFMEALLYLTDVSMWTLNVALMTFQQQYVSQMNLVLVGAMFNAIPVLILFFIFSKHYIEGVSFSGLKG